MSKREFGKTSKGEAAALYTIGNTKGMTVSITDFGAAVVAIHVPGKDNVQVDVTTGYDDVAPYERETCYFGATVARNANRIANAKFDIDGVTYQLEVNDNENNLHSGSNGTSEKIWAVKEMTDSKLVFAIVSKDLEQGFPGRCDMTVTYEVTEDNGLSIHYELVSDKKTVINPTNHTYFNLNGHASGKVYGHTLWLKASHYTPVINSHAIPTGEIAPVAGTPFDFTVAKTIGQDIEKEDIQLGYGNGYDHNFAIDKESQGMEKVATVVGDDTGIQMDVYTDLPGIQLYTGNFIGGQKGKDGAEYEARGAFCLETQYFPDAVNQVNFASPVYEAGQKYDSTTIYKFSIK